jgi:hypothetical protein
VFPLGGPPSAAARAGTACAASAALRGGGLRTHSNCGELIRPPDSCAICRTAVHQPNLRLSLGTRCSAAQAADATLCMERSYLAQNHSCACQSAIANGVSVDAEYRASGRTCRSRVQARQQLAWVVGCAWLLSLPIFAATTSHSLFLRPTANLGVSDAELQALAPGTHTLRSALSASEPSFRRLHWFRHRSWARAIQGCHQCGA